MNDPIFKFRRHDSVGMAGAEEDQDYLETCFIDTGALALLKDVKKNVNIIVGRTGSGKTALLQKLRSDDPEKVISISPEHLALTYVSNSSVLDFFLTLGVNLNPFFKLLWRHVLTVEILKEKFELATEKDQDSFLNQVLGFFSNKTRENKKHKDALQYLTKWGSQFWLETEYRVKEITTRLEDSLKETLSAELQAKISGISTAGKASYGIQAQLSEEQKVEIVSRAQRVVSSAQVQDLEQVITLLDELLEDRQKQCFVIIDKLDDDWVEERLRYKLIMALIETSRDFIRVKNAKVIIAMRVDLLERVFKLTRDSGFQEEKYQSLYLPVSWDKNEIIQVLNKRIEKLVAHRYTKKIVSLNDLLPKMVRKIPIEDYLYNRAPRPRDIIEFFNRCIAVGVDSPSINAERLKEAEAEYSNGRLRALADEWSANYPDLLTFAALMDGRTASFKLNIINDQDVDEFCLLTVADRTTPRGPLYEAALQRTEDLIPPAEFRRVLMRIFYKVGLVGVKTHEHTTWSWISDRIKNTVSTEVTDSSSIQVHPMYSRALGIDMRGSNK